MFLFMNKNPCHFELSNEIRQEKTLKISRGQNTYGDSDWDFCLISTYPWHSRYQCKSYPGSTVYLYLLKLLGSLGPYRVYKFVVIGTGRDLTYTRVGLLSPCIDPRVISFGGCRFILLRWSGTVGAVHIIRWRSFSTRGLGVIDGGQLCVRGFCAGL